jgi:hypothetical protein
MSIENENAPGTPGAATQPTAAARPAEDTAAGLAYQQTIKETIEKGVYEFEYIDGPRTGEKVTLDRQKISVAKMIELEKIRGEYTVIIMRSNSTDDKFAIENRLKAADLLNKIYSKCAEYYFHISNDDFAMMDWDSAKINLDAATNISITGRPNSQ